MDPATLPVDEWRTPRGIAARLAYRPGTSDWNTINSVIAADEYRMADAVVGPGAAVVVDVGAHVGAWAIAMLLDWPDAQGVAIEALPENAALARFNRDLNGLGHRLAVVEAAAASGEERDVAIGYGPDATHEFIGEALEVGTGPRVRPGITVATVSLGSVFLAYGPIRLLKIDCEGCEWSFLDDPAVAKVDAIVGEVHPRHGYAEGRLHELLDATHDVTSQAVDGFGPFVARLRPTPPEAPAKPRKRPAMVKAAKARARRR